MRPHVEFMNTPRGSLSRAAQTEKKTDGGMFWWTIAISLLVGTAVFSWIFSIYVFTHPEKPFSYGFLEKMHRLDELKQFDEKTVPSGRSYNPKELYQKFYALSDGNLKDNNSLLRRNYITNYKNKDERPFFVSGRFRVVHARPLTSNDVITTGMVARAVALNEDDKEFRNVIVEYVLPTIAAATPDQQFAAGDIIDIDSRRKKRRLYSSVINVDRMNEDVLVFTVIPLLYGEHTVDASKGVTLTAAPPNRLNLKAPLPITDSSYGAISSTAGLLPGTGIDPQPEEAAALPPLPSVAAVK